MKRFLSALLFFIPKANPDFDALIPEVEEWQLEIDPENFLPVREIGIGRNGNVLLIMPWRENYGYWTDNNLTLAGFKERFNCSELKVEEFQKNWRAIDADPAE